MDGIGIDVDAARSFANSPASRPWIATVVGYGLAITLLFVLLFVVPFVLMGL